MRFLATVTDLITFSQLLTMLGKYKSHILSLMCYGCDRLCRNELYSGTIVNERDYVSNLANYIRRPYFPFCNNSAIYSRTLNSPEEKLFGCDSIMVLRKGDFAKIGLFESKYPRLFTNPPYAWDKPLKSSGESRFTSQIDRQTKWANSGAVIWEMFFLEEKPGKTAPPYDKYGSNCLMHKDAVTYRLANKLSIGSLWNNNDLKIIFPKSTNLKKIIFKLSRCQWGNRFPIKSETISIKSLDNKHITIPVISRNSEIFNERVITNFLSETGLSNYIGIDLTETN